MTVRKRLFKKRTKRALELMGENSLAMATSLAKMRGWKLKEPKRKAG